MRSFLLNACQLVMRQAATTPHDVIIKKQLMILIAELRSSIFETARAMLTVFNDQDVGYQFASPAIDGTKNQDYPAIYLVSTRTHNLVR